MTMDQRALPAVTEGEAVHHADVRVPIWKGSCLEFLCGPEPTLQQQRQWYRWCAHICRDHAICGRTNPPGPF